jgi:anti-sigma factor RsiW
MKCGEFEARLNPYVDGELSREGMTAADSHVAECGECAALVRREREFRGLVRWQPREASPPELRTRILAHARHERRRRAWRLLPGLVTVATAVVTLAVLLTLPSGTPLIAQLVDKHIAYVQIERPVELASSDRHEIEAWFQQRAGLRIAVPDFSPAGIHLLGARLAEARERKAAYLLYEKGRILLSVFIVPVSGHDVDISEFAGTSPGQPYTTQELKGFRTVWWREGGAVFALVSALDSKTLLECAERLRLEREQQRTL